MFSKFERKSDRVKAVSFHHSRPWLLSGLHSGAIELIDYRTESRIAIYEDHVGPVRSVQFHPSLNLFCSGGDDFTVRVFNYKSCQFVLKGHLDYVRCVTFHPNLPWVMSGSDDSTAKIWNYQSRQAIAIITGHTHYVMQCQFHPTQDFLITCSLDQTARLWSYSTLKRRYAERRNQDYIISGAEVTLITIMDAHKDQINWCTFHPTQQYIVTAADDKKIKIWKYNESKAWEYDTLSGHTANVCSVAIHQKEDVIISDSEDHSIKIWDFQKRQELASYESKQQDRYWVVQCHNDNYYFACGSDTSLQVFTLHKDRVPMILVGDKYLCLAEKKQVKVIELIQYSQQLIKDFSGNNYIQFIGLSNISSNILEDNIEAIEYNQYDGSKTQLMVRLIRSFKDPNSLRKHILLTFQSKQQDQNLKFFNSRFACFLSANKIARINQSNHIELYNYENESSQILIEDYKSERIFPAPGGKILSYYDKQLDLIDPLIRKVIHSTDSQRVKSAKYTDQLLISLGKKTLTIYNKELIKIVEITEQINIKTAIFVNEIIFYSTKSQIKFLLLNGDTGIIRSTENIIYLAKGDLKGHSLKLIGMDNRGEFVNLVVEVQEALFKYAIYKKDLDLIQQLIKTQLGESTLAYLYKKKLASQSLKMVQDPFARFSLSIDCGNLEQAYKIAIELKDPKLYEQLREEACRQGNNLLVDICDQQLRQLDRLSLLYACLAQDDKLEKLQKINPTFQNALYQGNLEERINQLSSIPALQQLSAALHGKQVSLSAAQSESIDWILKQNPEALIPPQPVIYGNIQPWHQIEMKEKDQIILEIQEKQVIIPQDELFSQPQQQQKQNQQQLNNNDDQIDDDEPAEDQWGIEEELLQETKPQEFDITLIKNKEIKTNIAQKYFANKQYEQGFELLERQIGLKDKKPILNILKEYQSDQYVTQIPYILSDDQHVYASRLQELRNLIKLGQKQTTEAKFGDVKETFQKVLYKILVYPYNESDKQELQQIIEISRNYLLAMRCDQIKNEQTLLEMSCKMASIDLQPLHRILTLRQALSISYKQKNFITCSQIAKKLIELLKNDQTQKPEVLQNALKYEKASLQQNSNSQQIDFDGQWLDGKAIFSADTLKVITSYKQCSLDGSYYEQSYRGLCVLCKICEVGCGNIPSTARQSSSNAYVLAMKALQDKIKIMENERVVTPTETNYTDVGSIKNQLNTLVKENEHLNQQIVRYQQSQENVQNYNLQIEALQQERLQHLKDYQERVSDLIKKNEDLKKEKSDMQNQIDQLHRQLQAYKSNERTFQHKAELLKFEESAKFQENIQDLKQKLESSDNMIKKLEKRIEKLIQDKHAVEQDFLDYKDKYPYFKIQEYEKQLLQIRCQLEEKENQYLKNLDEIQNHRSVREDQLTKKIQDLLSKSNEYQSIIHQQTIEYKDLTLKYQQLKLKLEFEEKSKSHKKRNMSQENGDHQIYQNPADRTISRLNLDSLSPQITSPRFMPDQNIKHSHLKQAIKDCLEDLRSSTPFNKIQIESQQSNQRKKLTSPPTTTRNLEIENQLKQLNERYEMLIRQAQKESDFKQKAIIRKELLAIAEQIKELNKQK